MSGIRFGVDGGDGDGHLILDSQPIFRQSRAVVRVLTYFKIILGH